MAHLNVKTLWTCRRCSCVADFSHEHRATDISEARGVRQITITVFDTCIECGSEAVEEVVACETCGEVPAADGYDECLACDAKRERLAA